MASLFSGSNFQLNFIIMTTKTHRVLPSSTGGWRVTVDGGQRDIKHTDTKKEAVDIARKISQNQRSELAVHNKDGQIGQRDSHGNDPESSKG